MVSVKIRIASRQNIHLITKHRGNTVGGGGFIAWLRALNVALGIKRNVSR